jgi:hypothetical protein
MWVDYGRKGYSVRVAGSGTRTPRPSGRIGSRPRILLFYPFDGQNPKGGADDGATAGAAGCPPPAPCGGESSHGHAPRTPKGVAVPHQDSPLNTDPNGIG